MKNDSMNIDATATIAPTIRLRIAEDSTLVIDANCAIADGVEIEIAEEGAVCIGAGAVIGPNAVLRGHGATPGHHHRPEDRLPVPRQQK